MIIDFSPSVAGGTVSAPPSKSFLHRLVFCASLACGTSVIRNRASYDDILATLACARSLGARFSFDDGAIIIKSGDKTEPRFFCGESGSTLRFAVPCAMAKRDEAKFLCFPRLIERGIGEYEKIFAVERNTGGFFVRGSLRAGEYAIDCRRSSQFASGMMLALASLDEDSTLRLIAPVVSRPYIDVTVASLNAFGCSVTETRENEFSIPGGCLTPSDVTAEGDWSNAAPFLALGASVTGLNPTSVQGDRVCDMHIDALERYRAAIDLSDCPDLAPVLFAVSAMHHGGFFSGTDRLRFKESDRTLDMAEEMRKLGVETVIGADSVTVQATALHAPTEPVSSHGDHRIAMAMSVLLSRTGGRLCGAECVNKSFPDFFTKLETIGIKLEKRNDPL